jgi:hypothetical protein
LGWCRQRAHIKKPKRIANFPWIAASRIDHTLQGCARFLRRESQQQQQERGPTVSIGFLQAERQNPTNVRYTEMWTQGIDDSTCCAPPSGFLSQLG